MSQPPPPPARSIRLRRTGWLLVLLMSLLSLFSFFVQRPGMTSDIATYTLASEQFKAGLTTEPDLLLSVDPQNLSQWRKSKLTWWPRSYGAIPRRAQKIAATLGFDFDLGQTIRWIVVCGWILAILLWSWFFHLSTSSTALPWMIVVLLCTRYSHSNGYLFDGGEFFYWAIFPAVLLVNIAALKTRDSHQTTITLAVLAGLLTPGLVLLKYSAGLSSIGFAAAWIWVVYRKHSLQLRLFYWAIGAGISTGLIVGLGMLPAGNPTQIDSPVQWTPLLWATGAWLFAMTDLGTLLEKFTGDLLPAMGTHSDGSEGWLFLPLAFLVLLILRPENGKSADRATHPLKKQFVIIHLFGFSIVLAGLLVRGSAIHLDTRFLRPAAIAVMPWVIPPLISRCRNGLTGPIRISAFALAVILVLIPCLYGVLSLGHKTFVRSQVAAARTGPKGLRHDLLSDTGNAKAFFHELNRQCGEQDMIFITDPALGIPLSAKRLFTEEHAHLRTQEELQRRTYKGYPPGKLLLPLPQWMVTDGRATIIQNSFRDVEHWTTNKLDSQPDWVLFIGSH